MSSYHMNVQGVWAEFERIIRARLFHWERFRRSDDFSIAQDITEQLAILPITRIFRLVVSLPEEEDAPPAQSRLYFEVEVPNTSSPELQYLELRAMPSPCIPGRTSFALSISDSFAAQLSDPAARSSAPPIPSLADGRNPCALTLLLHLILKDHQAYLAPQELPSDEVLSWVWCMRALEIWGYTIKLDEGDMLRFQYCERDGSISDEQKALAPMDSGSGSGEEYTEEAKPLIPSGEHPCEEISEPTWLEIVLAEWERIVLSREGMSRVLQMAFALRT